VFDGKNPNKIGNQVKKNSFCSEDENSSSLFPYFCLVLKQRKHLITFLFIAGLLSATIGGLVHTFQNHEHSSCFAKNELHLHKSKNNCASFHQIQHAIQGFESAEEIVPLNSFFKSAHFLIPQKLVLQDCNIKKLRGPPVNVF